MADAECRGGRNRRSSPPQCLLLGNCSKGDAPRPRHRAHRLRLRYTPRMEAGKDRLWMTELECELRRVSLRGVRCGCSPAPTNATSEVQNSILAMLRW